MKTEFKHVNPDYFLSMIIFALRPYYMLTIIPVVILLCVVALGEGLYYSAEILLKILIIVLIVMLLEGGENVLNNRQDKIYDNAQRKLTGLTMEYVSERMAVIITGIVIIITGFLSLTFGGAFAFIFTMLNIASGLVYEMNSRIKNQYIFGPLCVYIGYFFLFMIPIAFFSPLKLKGILFAFLGGCFQGSLALIKDVKDKTLTDGRKTIFARFGMKIGNYIFLFSVILPTLVAIIAVFYEGIDIIPLFFLIIATLLTISLVVKRSHFLILMLRNGILTFVGFGYLLTILLKASFSSSILIFAFFLILACCSIVLITYLALNYKEYQHFEQFFMESKNFFDFQRYSEFKKYFENRLFLDSVIFFNRLKFLANRQNLSFESYISNFEKRIILCSEIFEKTIQDVALMEHITSQAKRLVAIDKLSLSEAREKTDWVIEEHLSNWTSPDYIFRRKTLMEFFNEQTNIGTPKLVVELGGLDIEISLNIAKSGFSVKAYKESLSLIQLGKNLAKRHQNLNYQINILSKESLSELENVTPDFVLISDPKYNEIPLEILLKYSIKSLKQGGILLLLLETNAPISSELVFHSFEDLKNKLEKEFGFKAISGFEHKEQHWSGLRFIKMTKYIYLMAIKGCNYAQ